MLCSLFSDLPAHLYTLRLVTTTFSVSFSTFFLQHVLSFVLSFFCFLFCYRFLFKIFLTPSSLFNSETAPSRNTAPAKNIIQITEFSQCIT